MGRQTRFGAKEEIERNGATAALRRVFLLSPAHCGGKRAELIFNDRARFELAQRIRRPGGVSIAEAFTFLSGLYFRGKVMYAEAFCDPPCGCCGAYVITTNRGLLQLNTKITLDELREMADGDIDPDREDYRVPLQRDVLRLADALGSRGCAVLLGSIASGKYCDILLKLLGKRLVFPQEFVGRGDMSRGGLMLRCVRAGSELQYVQFEGAVRNGKRPAKLGAIVEAKDINSRRKRKAKAAKAKPTSKAAR